MLSALIRFSLQHRPMVLAIALAVLAGGWHAGTRLPIEVLPDLTKPTVTILTESPGLAPEEVETLVTLPIESAVQGVSGLDRLRSTSDVGLSLVFAEFAWGTDIYLARQMVQERLQAISGVVPESAQPGMTPVASLMGEILLVGMRSTLPEEEPGYVAPMDLRTLADWTVRRRLQSIPGVADVLTIGGGVKQIHILPDPQKMLAHKVSISELRSAAGLAADNSTSGYLNTPTREIMVRNLGMTTDLEAIANTVVKSVGDRPVLVKDVARVEHDVQPMRGDAGVNGTPGVILSVDKAPGFDTLVLTEQIEAALAELSPSMPEGVELSVLFRQGDFIDHAFSNLEEAIRDGAVMVTLVLLAFLLSLRTTLITLTAIPLSFAISLLVFQWMDISVNSMTLGGLAVAIGMVVDDAIVDVENVLRRLRENTTLAEPKGRLHVIASASREVRSSILNATLIILLAFVPLLALQGIEGRLFTPVAIATMTSMAASFVVSLTVIPVLCSLLLRPKPGVAHRDSFVVRVMKGFVRRTFLRAAFDQPHFVLGITGVLLIAALMLYPRMGGDFLPAFNEGSATISLAAAPGTSLTQSNQIGEVGVRLLQTIPEIKSIGRRAGRAERDDHVMPVSVNEFDVEFEMQDRPLEEVFADIRSTLGAIPGTFVNVGQPIGHRLSHMLSGVSATIAVKLFGPDLDQLREIGTRIRDVAKDVPGLTDVNLETQVRIPQIKIQVDRERALAYGLQPGAINEQLSILIGGSTVSRLLEDQRTIDLVIRLPKEWRDSPERIASLLIETGTGERVPLRLVANVRESNGPNVIQRDNALRRIVIGANTSERDLDRIVHQWENLVAEKIDLPSGYFVRFEGQFQAREEAASRIGWLSAVTLIIIGMLLYGYFRSATLAAQVLLNIPLALMGGLVLTWILLNNVSIATLVGFIAVAGVAARNSIMMLSHYLHLMRHENETFSRSMIERGTLERLVPVLMTALAAGIALVPLVLAAGQPGKEILHPVAVVIVGGLVSSTLLDLAVTPAVFALFGRKAAERALRLGAAAAE